MALTLTTDTFSPMLIKELRQGLKSKSFYFAFLLMQGLMFFSVLMFATTMESGGFRSSGISEMFWFCLGAPLILITPLRALGALQQEVKANTLELIFLTRLSAWRIVAGKWLALFSQSLLLTVATLPYLFLRYFMGGINVSDDLMVMGWLLISSAGLTALGVCFSAFRAPWVRVVVVICAFLSPNIFIGIFFASRIGGGAISSAASHPLMYALALAAMIAVGIVLALFWGASRIAPPAENYSRWKRLLTLALLALVPALVWASGEGNEYFFALIIIIPMCMDALGEQPLFFPSVYMPFVRHGAMGRLASALLSPGWPSGIFFTLLCSAAFAAMAYAADLSGSSGSTIMGLAAALPGALLFPAALVLMVRPKAKNIIAGTLGIQVTCIILSIIAISVHESWQYFQIGFLHLIPPCSFVLHIAQQHDDDAWAFVNLIMTAIAFVFLVVRTRPVAAAIRKQEALAVQILAARKAAKDKTAQAP